MAIGRLALLTSMTWCTTVAAFAAGGTIVGRVVTAAEKEPLAGVTVLLQGTVRGTSTNIRGEFRLIDVPAGVHTLMFSMVGYQRETRPDVAVEEGKETTLNVTMIQTAIPTEQIVVTASKREQSLQEVPVSISVLDAAELKQRNALTIDDALRYIPGVNITGFQVNVRGSSGYSRGAGSRVLMLVDGVPFITGDTGELNFESIPVGQVDRIEVVKGASSALYGSNALGGVINIITKPIPETPETVIRTYGGFYNWPSYAQWRWSDKRRWFNGESISHARRSGDIGMALFVSRQIDDGYRQNDYLRRYNLYLRSHEELSPSQTLNLTFSLLYQYRGQFLYWRSLDSALVPPVLQESDNVKSIRYYTSGVYNDIIADNVLFTAKAIWYHNDWGFEAIHQIGRNESISDDINVELLSTIMFEKGHTLTAGLNGHFDIVNSDFFGNRTGGGGALFAQDELKLSDEFTLTLGARLDLQSIGITEAGAQLNPKAALAYTPVAGTTVRASYGRGFRIPSVAEAFLTGEVSNLAVIPNSDLKAEKSSSYEFGVSQGIGDWGTCDVAAFLSDYDNLIEAGLIVTSSNQPQIQWRNVTKARVQGFETSLKFGLFDGATQVNLGYTYVYPEDVTQHDLLKYRPRHLFYSNLLLHFWDFTAGGDFRFVSRVDRIDEELVEVGIVPDGDERQDVLMADFRLGADLSALGLPLTMTVNVNNAFQRNYVELIGNLMPPRTYVLVLEMKL
ncbi:MAG: TonB-dependent receptor [Bacteroidota bacterium]